jgi:hypothetical protein
MLHPNLCLLIGLRLLIHGVETTHRSGAQICRAHILVLSSTRRHVSCHIIFLFNLFVPFYLDFLASIFRLNFNFLFLIRVKWRVTECFFVSNFF